MAQELKDADIRKFAAPDKGTITVFDTKVKGFGIRIFAPTARNPKGARSFFFNYRVGGVERRHTIGEFPLFEVKEAREKAEELRKQVKAGNDPVAEKRERDNAPTVEDLIDRYIEDHLPTKACYGTFRERDERKMLEDIAQALGRKTKVADVHFGDIESMHRAITKSGRPVRANRTLAIASTAFTLALKPMAGERKPWRTEHQGNPCKGVERNGEDAAERFFSVDELSAIAEALDGADEKSSADCIRLIMLTGCRPCEAMRAKWSEFDAEPGFWVKPSAHTKQRKVHKAPLGAAAKELIEKLRQKRKTGPWVFPGNNPGDPVKHVRTVWRSARRRATVLLWANTEKGGVADLVLDLKAQLDRQPTVEEIEDAATAAGASLPPSLATARIYDLRHTFASLGAANNMGLPVIGKLLGHTQPRTTQRYTHLADNPMREAAEQINTMIGDAIRTVRTRRKADVNGD
jgi:integrase